MKLLQTIFWLGLITALVGFFGITGMWVFFPENPVTFDIASIRIITPQVKAGDELIYTVRLVKYAISPAIVSRTLMKCDGTKAYSMPHEVGALPVGKYELSVDVPIPKRVDPGMYRMVAIFDYAVNPLQNVIKTYQTPSFEVIP